MKPQSFLLPLLALVSSTSAAPTELVERQAQASTCGQYDQQTSGPFTLSANHWGASTSGTTGSQCMSITGLVGGNSLQWTTSWTWANNPTQVKSYTNAQISFTQKAVSAYQSIKTSWTWAYTGTSIAANVAYDTFLGQSASSANLFEVMVWLGLYGGVSPLSANGYPFTPIANTTISGVIFDLAYGLNGNVKVYSFVARNHAQTTFSGDILDFYRYLAANYASNGFSTSLVVQNVQAGSEVFTGSNAVLKTTNYTIAYA